MIVLRINIYSKLRDVIRLNGHTEANSNCYRFLREKLSMCQVQNKDLKHQFVERRILKLLL